MSASGFTLWFTGLSGAGKSTLAEAIARRLREERPYVEVLDGDEIRRVLGGDLGYAPADRTTNMWRLGFIADLLSRNGAAAVVAAMSPYRAVREEIRRAHHAPFIEVFVDCPLDVLERRDTKGLYARARAGDLTHVIGVSGTYEPPESPDVAVRTDRLSIEESVARISGVLRERMLLKS